MASPFPSAGDHDTCCRWLAHRFHSAALASRRRLNARDFITGKLSSLARKRVNTALVRAVMEWLASNGWGSINEDGRYVPQASTIPFVEEFGDPAVSRSGLRATAVFLPPLAPPS
jgi:hypothetical protein